MLTNCPNCGEETSASAKHCVHCGCEITDCSDCGHAAVGEPAECSECSCKINVDAKVDTPQNAPHKSKLEILHDEWAKRCPKSSAMLKRKKTISEITNFIFILFLIISFIILAVWDNKSDIEKIAGYSSVVTAIRLLIVFGAMSPAIFIFVHGIIELILTLRLADEFKNNAFCSEKDIRDACNTSASQNAKLLKLFEFIKIFFNAAYIGSHGKEMKSFIVNNILFGIISVVMFIGLAVFLYKLGTSLVAVIGFDAPFVFEYAWLIVFGVALFFVILFTFVDMTGYKGRQNKWIESCVISKDTSIV